MNKQLGSWIVLGSTAVIAAIILGFLLLPLWQDIGQAENERDEFLQTAETLEARQAQLIVYAKDKELNARFAERLAQIAPEDNLADTLILLIEQYGQKLNIQTTVLSVADSTKEKNRQLLGTLPAGTEELHFTLELKGDFTNLKPLLNEFEHGAHLLDIRLVALQQQSDGTVRAQVEGRAFWKAKPTTPETNAIYRINSAEREAYLAPTATLQFLPPSESATGRPNPFAPLP